MKNGLLAIKEARKILSEIEVMTIKSVSSTAQGIPCHWEAVPPILSWTLYGWQRNSIHRSH